MIQTEVLSAWLNRWWVVYPSPAPSIALRRTEVTRMVVASSSLRWPVTTLPSPTPDVITVRSTPDKRQLATVNSARILSSAAFDLALDSTEDQRRCADGRLLGIGRRCEGVIMSPPPPCRTTTDDHKVYTEADVPTVINGTYNSRKRCIRNNIIIEKQSVVYGTLKEMAIWGSSTGYHGWTVYYNPIWADIDIYFQQ